MEKRNKKDPLKHGVFFCIDENGNATDKNIVDQMLQDGNDERLREELIRAGVIRRIELQPKKPNKT